MNILFIIPALLMVIAIILALLAALFARKSSLYNDVTIAALRATTHEEMDEAMALSVKADRAWPGRVKSDPAYLEAYERVQDN